MLKEIEAITGRTARCTAADWRQGDQPWFVADTGRLTQATGWRARIGWQDGLRDLAAWLAGTRGLTLPRERRRA